MKVGAILETWEYQGKKYNSIIAEPSGRTCSGCAFDVDDDYDQSPGCFENCMERTVHQPCYPVFNKFKQDLIFVEVKEQL